MGDIQYRTQHPTPHRDHIHEERNEVGTEQRKLETFKTHVCNVSATVAFVSSRRKTRAIGYILFVLDYLAAIKLSRQYA